VDLVNYLSTHAINDLFELVNERANFVLFFDFLIDGTVRHLGEYLLVLFVPVMKIFFKIISSTLLNVIQIIFNGYYVLVIELRELLLVTRSEASESFSFWLLDMFSW
jgi:hypothetical protein